MKIQKKNILISFYFIYLFIYLFIFFFFGGGGGVRMDVNGEVKLL